MRAVLTSPFAIPGGAAGKVYREFRTNRRPLNVASVVSRTVEQETLPAAPPGMAKGRPQFGVALSELLMYGCYSASW